MGLVVIISLLELFENNNKIKESKYICINIYIEPVDKYLIHS